MSNNDDVKHLNGKLSDHFVFQCKYLFFIIIIIRLSFIARLNKNYLAQKRVTEKCLIITQFE